MFAPPSVAATTEITDKSGKRLAAGPAVTWSKAVKNAPGGGCGGGSVEDGADDSGIRRGVHRCIVLHALAPDRCRSREAARSNVRPGRGSARPEHGANSARLERLRDRLLQLRRRHGRSRDEAVQHRPRPRLHHSHAESGRGGKSRHFLFRLAVEPAGMDEIFELDARRQHPPGKYSGIRAVPPEICGELRRRRRKSARAHHAE